ncbi:AraC family transcriptional regulator [Alkalihalobacillus oceani]|uniref:helix-turn-helix domain-containing protein n=1 Tax=Halalkalibacter oceani TaxID=1653776 RepID=UPI00203A4211|nr:AraC family transcriptional regulator [Halalkalibacter oceani]MCM3763143.1 AraC family transcriptional regulator [Halalkalibacter oceani]
MFYQYKTGSHSTESLSIVPDGCFDVLFCCNPLVPSAVVWTSSLKYSKHKQSNFYINCEYFGVRFFPEQNLLKLNYSMKEILNKQIPLCDAVSFDERIIERIAAATSFEERIRFFKKHMKVSRVDAKYDQNIINFTLHEIYSSKRQLNIKRLSEQSGYSDRYLRKKFEEYIGFSPKQFSQIVKFQSAMKKILLSENFVLSEIVHENGYYDQSHLIKDFKKYSNLPPCQFKEHYETMVRNIRIPYTVS